MLIGIDASRAFLQKRTGIEEYAYQTIKHLRGVIPRTEAVILYLSNKSCVIDFSLPPNWKTRILRAPRFWTQAALSLQMLFQPPDVLFVPAHTVPFIHPTKTVVTIHGLEYEFCRNGYSFWARLYMRFFIRFSCRAASVAICVSENTKKDVMKLYGIAEEKIRVIYEGFERIRNNESRRSIFGGQVGIRNEAKTPFVLFVGRLEERKNIVRIIEAFEMLKEKYNIPHELVFIGKPGYGYESIKYKVESSKHKASIVEIGYVGEEEKWAFLQNAEVFLFPTLYEGFGLPVLEAQAAGVPVVASGNSSLPEVAKAGAIYVDPNSAESIAEGAWKIFSDNGIRDDIISKGLENVKRFSWEKCAKQIAEVLLK